MEYRKIPNSKYPGRCKLCGQTWEIGDPIFWAKDQSPKTICAGCGAEKEGKDMGQYQCSYCGEYGHNRRTCGKLRENQRSPRVDEVRENPQNPAEFVAAGLTEQLSVDDVQAGKIPSLWEMVESVVSQHRLTLLYGPPGTGKTTVANRCAKEGQLVLNVTLTEETPAAELRGHYIPKGGDFVWQDGPAVTAFRYGHRLVLNEIDKASGDAMVFCHALCDDPEVSMLTLPTGEIVRPHESFSVVATMNGVPEDLPHALRDRFVVKFCVDQIHPDAVKTLPSDLRDAARKAVSWDEDRAMSLRGWRAYATLRETLGEQVASVAVFGDRAETIKNTLKIGQSDFKRG